MRINSRQQLLKTIDVIGQQRTLLGNAVVDATLLALHDQLAQLETQEALAMQDQGRPAVVIVLFGLAPESNLTGTLKSYGYSTLALPAVGSALVLIKNSSAPPTDIAEVIQLSLDNHSAFLKAIIDTRVIMPGHEIAFGLQVNKRLNEAINGITLVSAAYQQVRGQYFVTATAQADLFHVETSKTAPRLLGRLELESVSREMVGRATELQRLQYHFTEVIRDKTARFVLITGLSGVGKSRLLFEFDKWVELLETSVFALEGNASVSERTLPYGLLREFFAQRFDITDQHTEAEARQRFVDGLGQLAQRPSVRRAHIIGQLIGLDFSRSPHLLGLRNDPQRFQSVAYEAVVEMLRTIQRERNEPIMLRIEDLHAADSETLHLLDYLVHQTTHVPLLIVAAAQPALFERLAPHTRTDSRYRIVQLHSLSEDASHQFLKRIFGNVDNNTQLMRRIVHTTGGNPFYMEEVVRLLHDEGVLVRGLEHWHINADNTADTHIPSTVMGVLQARINALSIAERTVLQHAAAVGQIFWDRAVMHLQSEDQEASHDTHETLRQLHRRNMIVPRQRSIFDGTQEYMFSQSMLYLVAYNSLRQSQRRRYHLQLAQWFIGRSMQSVGENAQIIAQHYTAAGEVVRAVKWYGLAARQAFDAFLPERAAAYYDRAFALLPDDYDDPRVQIQLYEGYGKVLTAQARYHDAIAAYTAVCIGAERRGDLLTQAAAWYAMSHLQLLLDDAREGLRYIAHAITLAERAGPTAADLHLRALAMAAILYTSIDDIDTATATATAAGALLNDEAEPRTRAEVLFARASTHFYRFALTSAATDLNTARIAAANAHDTYLQARIMRLHGWVLMQHGQLEGALHMLRQAHTLAEQSNVQHDIIAFTNDLGIALGHAEQYQESVDLLTKVLAIVGHEGWYGLVGTYAALTANYLALGDPVAAWQCARECHRAAYRHPHPTDHGVAWRALGQVAAAQGQEITVDDQTYSITTCFEKSVASLQKPHQRWQLAYTYRTWAKAIENDDATLAATYRDHAAQIRAVLDQQAAG